MASRSLMQWEKSMALHVFQNTVPYDKVMISDGIGAGGRPYTVPDIGSPGKYIIHMGPQAVPGVDALKLSMEHKATLIHELTHVWQGHNGGIGYVLGSLWSQAKHQNMAYWYSPVQWKDWGDYNVEQQAQIVEDWFKNGSHDRDPRWRYIRDNIRNP